MYHAIIQNPAELLVPSRLYANTYLYMNKTTSSAFIWLYYHSICTLIHKLQALQVGEFSKSHDLQNQNEQSHEIHVQDNGKICIFKLVKWQLTTTELTYFRTVISPELGVKL